MSDVIPFPPPTASTNDYFGVCPRCKRISGIRNIGRDHHAFCDLHRVTWWIGSNLFSGWQDETEADWRKNQMHVAGYRSVDPYFPGAPSDE